MRTTNIQIPLEESSLGKMVDLQVLRETPQGLYLNGHELGELLLPRRYASAEMVNGTSVRVFVHRDSEDRLVAVPKSPVALRGEFGTMEVASFKPGVGAFLDWGLDKDLLLPLREMAGHVVVGQRVVVSVLLDATSGRLIASRRLERHAETAQGKMRRGDKVALIVVGESPLGVKMVVNRRHLGMVNDRRMNQPGSSPLGVGQEMEGFVQRIRADGRVDLSLEKVGGEGMEDNVRRLLTQLRDLGGRLPLGDQSHPETIRLTTGMSKRAFKDAIGRLYKKGLVERDGEVWRLCEREPSQSPRSRKKRHNDALERN